MSDVVDIKTRRSKSFEPSTLNMTRQLVAEEGVLEIVRILEFMSYDDRDISPVYQKQAEEISEEFRSQMSDILKDAAEEIQHLEDRWFGALG